VLSSSTPLKICNSQQKATNHHKTHKASRKTHTVHSYQLKIFILQELTMQAIEIGAKCEEYCMHMQICLHPDFVSHISQKETPYLDLEPPSRTVKILFASKFCPCFERESDADRERETQTDTDPERDRLANGLVNVIILASNKISGGYMGLLLQTEKLDH